MPNEDISFKYVRRLNTALLWSEARLFSYKLSAPGRSASLIIRLSGPESVLDTRKINSFLFKKLKNNLLLWTGKEYKITIKPLERTEADLDDKVNVLTYGLQKEITVDAFLCREYFSTVLGRNSSICCLDKDFSIKLMRRFRSLNINLEWLLDYELKQSARHRRFASLVMLSANGSSKKLDGMLEDVVRASDAIFFLNDAIAVLMGETDTAGALKAVNRYRELISAMMDVQYAVSSFPLDGKASKELIDIARRRLNVADTSDSGVVVDQG